MGRDGREREGKGWFVPYLDDAWICFGYKLRLLIKYQVPRQHRDILVLECYICGHA